LRYTDESGEIFWLIPAVGALIGAYMGGVAANESYNPTKWDFSSGKTWWNMLAGGAVGGVSAYAGATVAASGIPFANTISIAGASLTNSVGTWMYSFGETDLSISLGAVSYNFSTGDFGYIGKEGNSALENLGYGLGMVANINDVIIGLKPNSVTLRTENRSNRSQKDILGHSQLEKDGSILVDWGPVEGERAFLNNSTNSTNAFKGGIVTKYPKGDFWSPIEIKGVNLDRIVNYGYSLNNNNELYQMVLNGCVTKASNALNLGGAFNIGVLPGISHPYWLHFQMRLYANGYRPWIYAPHIQNP
jgi:hypothetical protein